MVSSLLSLMIMFGTSSDELPVGSPLWTFLTTYLIIGLIAFYKWEKNIEEPIVPVQLLHHRTILAACINCWFTQLNYHAGLFYLPFYWTSVQNLSPLEACIRLIPSILLHVLHRLLLVIPLRKQVDIDHYS
ncbi:hypothetical protein DAMA08_031340 [Martiniozyma asiatica (nom. inval.)]|nr:hypothetical protein DAMA08_031340 [Martiniozyma asiatica]